MKSPFTGGNATFKFEPSELTYRKEVFKFIHLFYECDETQERFTIVRNYIGKRTDTLAAKAIIQDGFKLNLPLSVVMTNYGKALESYAEQLPLIAAEAIVGIVLISDTPLDKVAQISQDLIDDLFHDFDFVTKVSEAMNSVLNEVLVNEQVGVPGALPQA